MSNEKKNVAPVVNTTVNPVSEKPADVQVESTPATSEPVIKGIIPAVVKGTFKTPADALSDYRLAVQNKDIKASDLNAAKEALDKSILSHNNHVLREIYDSCIINEQPFVKFFTMGTWEKMRYSSRTNSLETSNVRLDVLDFIKDAAEHKNDLVNMSVFKAAMDSLVASIRLHVTAEMNGDEDINVSNTEIVNKLQAVMDCIKLPEFEGDAGHVKVYARPKDAKFLKMVSVKAAKEIGKIEVLKADKIAAYVMDVYHVQINHEQYKVK